MNKEKFIFVIGHGRSGTSLCTGLINSSPDFNLGYEINNSCLNFPFKQKKFPEDEYNGNKIVIFHESNVDKFFELLYQKKFIISPGDKDIYMVFTKRDLISTMVSKKKKS